MGPEGAEQGVCSPWGPPVHCRWVMAGPSLATDVGQNDAPPPPPRQPGSASEFPGTGLLRAGQQGLLEITSPAPPPGGWHQRLCLQKDLGLYQG